jgi:2-aminoethylphosphonate-pyruvate transaminase
MRRLGLVPFLNPEIQSFIITAFHSPTDPAFQFSEFYHRLSDRGMIIFPGKLTRVDTFRIDTIGHLFETDIAQLLHAIEDVPRDMSCSLPLDR